MNLLAQYYHLAFSYPDAEIIQSLLLKTGGPLIDFGCATGRVLEIATESGFAATGIDDSSDMISHGRQRLQNKNVEFVQGRYERQIPKYLGKFGVVTIAANTYFMTLEKAGRQMVLRTAGNYLKPDGRIFIYVRANAKSKNNERFRIIELSNEDALNFHIHWSEKQGIREFTLDFKKGTLSQQFTFKTSIVSLSELKAEFHEGGFKIEEAFGDFDKSPISEDSIHWFFILKQEAV